MLPLSWPVGLPAELLELELTESFLMEATGEANNVLVRLRQSGVKLAIDDFGTGFSSLDYLRRHPVDRVKVAQDFVRQIWSTRAARPSSGRQLGSQLNWERRPSRRVSRRLSSSSC